MRDDGGSSPIPRKFPEEIERVWRVVCGRGSAVIAAAPDPELECRIQSAARPGGAPAAAVPAPSSRLAIAAVDSERTRRAAIRLLWPRPPAVQRHRRIV